MSKHQAINRFGVSSNPAFSQFQKINVSTIEGKMTLDGAVNKTAILLSLCFAGAFFGWNIPGLIMPAAIIGFDSCIYHNLSFSCQSESYCYSVCVCGGINAWWHYWFS